MHCEVTISGCSKTASFLKTPNPLISDGQVQKDSRASEEIVCHRRQNMSYSAHFHSLGTAREHQTKDEAAADLASMITFLCEHESAEVKIASVHGHVGSSHTTCTAHHYTEHLA